MIDLRSDVCSVPTDAMWEAMRDAELGWALVGEDTSVNTLCERVATLLGKPAALWLPTLGMGNLVAMLTFCAPGEKVVLEAASHVLSSESMGITEIARLEPAPLWAADGRISHKGRHYSFEDVRITPKPVQKPIPTYVASFSKLSIELAARLGCGLIVAPFAAAMSFGGLKQVADLYNETCVKYGNKPGRLMCSYFTHFADSKEQEAAQRARQIRYYKECVIPAFPGDPKTAPPSYRYFIEIVERLNKIKAEDLTENSVLIGAPAQITDTLKKVEAAGFSEVILYFNVGLKPHAQVKEEMDRFMREVAPAFEGQHKRRAA